MVETSNARLGRENNASPSSTHASRPTAIGRRRFFGWPFNNVSALPTRRNPTAPFTDIRPGGASSSPSTSVASSSSMPKSTPDKYSASVRPPRSVTSTAKAWAASHSQRRTLGVEFSASAAPARMKAAAELAFMWPAGARKAVIAGTSSHQPASTKPPMSRQNKPAPSATRPEVERRFISVAARLGQTTRRANQESSEPDIWPQRSLGKNSRAVRHVAALKSSSEQPFTCATAAAISFT
ncbi:MAG: hypothetical protein FD161_3667 [Limisphaerales bacterium]|nr:MAG: hypothetical protein FD161_3667 [Limisphaerales bacterium]